MNVINCNIHNVNYRLPETETEFLSGEFHNDILELENHIEQNPDCVLLEIIDE